VKAYIHIRRKEVARHREWMIRMYGVALGVATTRPIVGMFFAFRRLTPHEFFGIAFWLGFTITFLAAEAWVDYTRQRLPADDNSQRMQSEQEMSRSLTMSS